MKRTRTDGIVVHRAEVYSGRDYHFLIQRSGQIQLLVPQDEVGEHSVCFNKTTIAIAVFGDFASAEKGLNLHPTTTQVTACVSLIDRLQAEYGLLWVAGHSDLGIRGTRFLSKLIPGHTCPGEYFPLDHIITQSGCLPFPEKAVGVKIL